MSHVDLESNLETNIVSTYERDGFVVVPSMFTPAECAEFKRVGGEVLREHAGPNSSIYVGVSVASPFFYRLASDERIVAVLRQLMPEGVMFLSDKFVVKSGEKRSPTPWHCDLAYWPNTRPKLSVWIPLEDVTAANGALKVLPGAHTLTWRHSKADPREFDVTIQDLPPDAPGQAVCEMKAGSALFFTDRLPHASTPNGAGTDRYALISTYHAPGPDEPFDLQFKARHVIVPTLQP